MLRFLTRAWQLTRHPAKGWVALGAALPTPSSSLLGFLLPGAIMVAVAAQVGLSVIGFHSNGFSYKLPWPIAVKQALLGVAATLALGWLAALVANRLAPLFGGQPNFARAAAAVAHAGAPVFLAALILLWPAAAWLITLAGLLAVYVLHIGLRVLMQPRDSHATPYTASVIAVMVVLVWLLSLLTQCSPARMGQDVEIAQIVLESIKKSGAPATTANKRTVEPEAALNGKGGSGAAPLGQGGGGTGDLEPADKSKDAAAGVGTGVNVPGESLTTRTVLEAFLPGDVEGFTREVVENHAFSGKGSKAGEAATFLMRGAYVKVMYKAKDRSHRWRSLSIADLTPELGKNAVNLLLQEIVQTGGESSLSGGRQRGVEDTGARMVVTVHQPHREPAREFASYEVVLGSRFRVVAESQGLAPDALREWVLRLDLHGIEERARSNKPIE